MSTLWTTPGSYAELCLNCGHCAIDHQDFKGRCFEGRCWKVCKAFVGRAGAQATLLPTYNGNPFAEKDALPRSARSSRVKRAAAARRRTPASAPFAPDHPEMHADTVQK